MKHTPGPWRATDTGYISSDRHGYVPLRSPFRTDAFSPGPNRADVPEDVLIANARLIAAAPELLDEFESAAENLCATWCPGSIRHSDDCRRRRALIAKATGIEP